MKINMSKQLEQLAQAPDFELKDTQGKIVRLADYRGQPVVLVLLRGFV